MSTQSTFGIDSKPMIKRQVDGLRKCLIYSLSTLSKKVFNIQTRIHVYRCVNILILIPSSHAIERHSR